MTQTRPSTCTVLANDNVVVVQYRTRISSPLMRAFASHRMRAFASHRIASHRIASHAGKCAHVRAFASHARNACIRIPYAKMRAYARIRIPCAKMRTYARIRIACAEMRRERRITTRKTRKWDSGNDASPSVLAPDPWNWVCSRWVHSQILRLRLKLKKILIYSYTSCHFQ